MTKICISGATGQIGHLIVKELLKKTPASNITLTSRNTAKLSKEAELGMTVCKANYTDSAALEKAYEGCDAVMLISGAEIGKRIDQHRNAIQAAEKMGVKHIVYTSVSGCHPMNPTPSSCEHFATEQMLQQSSVSYTALRNHFYAEFIKGLCLAALRSGTMHFTGEKGLISPVSVEDIASCAATILCESEKHENVIYELTGPEMLSIQEITRRVSDLYDTPMEYVSVSLKEMYDIFEQRGIPLKGDLSKPVPHLYGAAEICENYAAIDQLFHATLTSTVEQITGKKPKSLDDVLREGKERWLASLAAKGK